MKNLRMIDIGKKNITEREAIAKVEVLFPEEIFEKVKNFTWDVYGGKVVSIYREVMG